LLIGQAISVILLNLLILGVMFAIILRRVHSLQLVAENGAEKLNPIMVLD
jgi:hypothetical protein